MENKQKPERVELNDEQLDSVVGGFTEGNTIYLKTGTMHCAQCGLKGVNTFTYLGKGQSLRMALVRLTCGHEEYIPETALKE